MTKFEREAPWAMDKLIKDFDFSVLDAAAVMGNAGHESGGLELFQELNPTVKGSRGGFGWFQWTGPRRREYEAYCSRNKLDPYSKEANYAFLFLELKTSEKSAVPKTKAAKTLEDKVKAFEMAYERAGVKHYPSRNIWAKRALATFQDAPQVALEAPQKPLEPVAATPVAQPKESALLSFLKWLRGLFK